jgi:hypothetical protein
MTHQVCEASKIEVDKNGVIHCECDCGMKWAIPRASLALQGRARPWDEACVKCGESSGHDVRHVCQIFETLDGVLSNSPREHLRLTCRFCQYEHDIPTMDANATPTPSPTDDPMQAHVTLGALRKILDDRGEDLIERAREIIAKECAALAERIRRDPR